MDEKMTKRELKELRRLEQQEQQRAGASGGSDLTGILFLQHYFFNGVGGTDTIPRPLYGGITFPAQSRYTGSSFAVAS